MKKILLLGFVAILSATALGQKIKFIDDVAYVDGVAFLNWRSNGAFDTHINISALTAPKDEIFVCYLSYTDSKLVTSSNPKGSVSYVELNFFGLGVKCEIEHRTPKGIVKFLIENEIYAGGVLNEENVAILIAKYGTRYSDNRPGGTVIINIGK
jgi:hypothetical protein